MNKKIIVLVIVIALIVISILSINKQRVGTSDGSVTQSTSTQLLQSSPYIDPKAKFSIILPVDWVVKNINNSTTSSNTWFYNPSGDNGSSTATIVVGRFERTPKMNEYIKKTGDDKFLSDIAGSLISDIYQFSTTSSQKIVINTVPFAQFSGTYMGGKTKKQITQNLYLTLTDKAYYLIGMDVYTDSWLELKDAILQSVSTFTLLP